MDLGLLGPLEVRDKGELLRLGGPKPRALLAMLAFEANRLVGVERLIDVLWQDTPPASARQTVHYFVHRLRRALGDPDGRRLVTRGSGYLLALGAGELDIDRFRALAASADGAAAAGDLDAAAAALDRALALWRGPALADLAELSFARAAAAELEELRIGALTKRIELALALGCHDEVAGELGKLVQAYPLHERFHALRMLALYRSGRRVEALADYEAARAMLADRLGLEPGPELQRMARAVQAQDPALDLAEMPTPPASGGTSAAPPADGRADAPVREERKPLTALAAQLADATAAGDDLEDAQARLRRRQDWLREIVQRHGGTVHATVGDAALAVFGAPLARDDDPVRAVRAALELGATASVTGSPPRIGVATGEALVVPGASGESPEVAGSIVGEASQLSSLAPPGAVVAGAATVLASRRVIDYEVLATAPGQPEAWLATAVRHAGTDNGPRSPLLERGTELTLLEGLLGRVRGGNVPHLVTIVGTPGIGKTRLVLEFGRLVDAAPGPGSWLVGRSVPDGRGVAFWALGEIVKARTGIRDGDRPEWAVAKLATTVERVLEADGEELAWFVSHLAPLVGTDDAERRGGERLGADRDEAFAAWRRFVEAMAAEPLVLVFEDLHWANDGLLDFLDELAEQARAVPLLVVATARPELLERRPAWGGGKRNATTVSLSGLSPGGTEELLAALLGRELDPATKAAVLRSAEGNPLFVEEYVHMLRDQSDVGRRSGADAGLAVPASVQQVLAARLDALPSPERMLLEDASVLGEVGWRGAFVAVSGRPPEEVDTLLERLVRRGLVRRMARSSVAGEREFAFRHALVRDAGYARLPRADRAERHNRAAEWLEARGLGMGEQVAHHLLRALELYRAVGREPAGLAGRTRRALREAADRARRLTAYADAARLYEAALELWPTDESTGKPAAGAERPALLLRLGTVRVWGERRGREVLTEARDAFLATGDRGRAAEALAMLAHLDWLNDLDAFNKDVDELFALARRDLAEEGYAGGETGSRWNSSWVL